MFTKLGLISIAGAIIAFVALAGAAIYFRLLPSPLERSAPPERSARYYPEDALAYFWLSLNPGGSQRQYMLDIWNRLEEYSAFQDWKKDARNLVLDETGVGQDENIFSWVGAEISIGIMGVEIVDGNFEELEFDAVLTVDVRDPGIARDFLAVWVAYMEEDGEVFKRRSVGDFDMWISERNGEAFALSDDIFVAASAEWALDEVVRRIRGEGEDDMLLGSARFEAARASLPTLRFSSAYVSGDRIVSVLHAAEDSSALGASFHDALPDWIAGSAGWMERGLVLDLVTPLNSDSPGDERRLTDVARLVPQDTMVLLAFAFNPEVQSWRDVLSEYDLSGLSDEVGSGSEIPRGLPFSPANLNFAHMLDFGLLGFDIMTGIDLEHDFFAHLDGEFALSVREFDYAAALDDPEVPAIDAAMLLSYSDEGEHALEDTMKDFADWLQTFEEFEIDKADIGAEKETVLFRSDDLPYSPGYAMNDGYLTLGSTAAMLEQSVRLQNGEGLGLATQNEYLRAVEAVGEPKDMLLYMDIHSLMGLASDELLDFTDDQIELLQEALGSLTAVTSDAGAHSRVRVALMLFPE